MTDYFERNYVIDNLREIDGPREKHHKIELSDRDHRERLQPTLIISKELQDAGFVYKPPIEEDAMSPALKEKFEKARKLTKDTKVVDIRKKDAKSKSKSTERKSKKIHSKSKRSAVEKVQE